jgi:amidase
MSGMTELWQMSAGELARLIRERQASSREVVDAHLDRIDAVNGRVNAIVEVLAEPACEADAADRGRGGEAWRAQRGARDDQQNIDVRGTATTLGLQALRAQSRPRTVRRGAAPRSERSSSVARTCPTSLRWHTDSSLAGATINRGTPRRRPALEPAGSGVACHRHGP